MGVTAREKIKDSGVWWVLVAHKGRRVSRRVGNCKAAQEAARKIEARLTLGASIFDEKAKPPAPTLQQYFKSFERSYRVTLKPTTWLSYETSLRVHIMPELGDSRLDEITRVQMKNLVSGLVGKGLAPGLFHESILDVLSFDIETIQGCPKTSIKRFQWLLVGLALHLISASSLRTP